MTAGLPSSGGNRIIILGLDGATWDLLAPWMEAGELPTLARLRREGAWGPLRSVYPPGTGPAWSTVATGVGPGKHGIYEFMRRRRGSYFLSPVDSRSLRRLTLWDILAGEGEVSYLLNVPLTYPPRPMKGLMVTGILTPPQADDFTFPPGLSGEIERQVPGYNVMPEATYRPGAAASYLAALKDSLDRKGRLILSLARSSEWKLLFQVWNETDMVQHALWHLDDDSHPHHDPREKAQVSEGILAIYRQLDGIIERLLTKVGDDAVVAVVSDHGAGALHRLVHINNWLLRCGYLAVKPNPISLFKHWSFRCGFTPMLSYSLVNRIGLGRLKSRFRWRESGYRLMRRIYFSFGDVNWSRTVAYGVGGGVSGGVFLNVRGREPQGRVSSGAEYERIRSEVADSLLELPDPATGTPVMERVYRREEIYAGPHLDEAPDLVAVPRDPTYGIFGDFEFSSRRLVEDAPPALSGHHRMEGVLILWGRPFLPGATISGAGLEDVTPTLLHAVGLSPSADMDGSILEEAFVPEAIEKVPVKKVERPPTRDDDAAGPALTPEEEAAVRERLRNLGYIS